MNELDQAEQRAIEMVQFFQDQCREQCAPYLKIIANIRALRQQVLYVDGQLLVPFLPSAHPTPAEPR